MKEPDPPPAPPQEQDREEFLGEMLQALTSCLERITEDENTPREVITNGKDLVLLPSNVI